MAEQGTPRYDWTQDGAPLLLGMIHGSLMRSAPHLRKDFLKRFDLHWPVYDTETNQASYFDVDMATGRYRIHIEKVADAEEHDGQT